jgi:hypothetical protein
VRNSLLSNSVDEEYQDNFGTESTKFINDFKQWSLPDYICYKSKKYINPSLITENFPKNPELQSDDFLIKRIKNKISAARSRQKKKLELKHISDHLCEIRRENIILGVKYNNLKENVDKLKTLVKKI